MLKLKNSNENTSSILALLLSCSIQSQTPYPLSFYWTGKISGFADFEMRVNMYESDKLLLGNGSKIKGECLFLNDFEYFLIEGDLSNNNINFNCINADGKIIYSFQFEVANGKEVTQKGKWTDGQKNLDCTLKTNYKMNLSKAQLTCFCVGVNLRRNELIHEDSIFAEQFKQLPKILFLPIGECYRLGADSYLQSQYYGNDYLEFKQNKS